MYKLITKRIITSLFVYNFSKKKKEELKNSNLQIDEKSSSKFRIGQIE